MTGLDADAPTTRAFGPAATTSGPAEEEAGGWLTVDLGAVVENWRMLSRRITPVRCAAVVKADAYGCGLEPVAKALAQAGCQTFFVAHLDEARRVRAVADDVGIYVLNGFPPGTARAFADANVRPVLGSMVELAEWDAFVRSSGWEGGAALQVDTGMNRLGIDPTEAIGLAARMQQGRHGITLVMSHFACADTPEHPLNTRQIAQFRELRMAFRGIPASLANSAGIFLGPAAHFDMARPGLALYGANPVPARGNPMRPVIELRGRIAQIRTLQKGETVGYGAAWKARRPTRLAVVAVGYGDGYQRAASGTDRARGAEVVVAGKRCPIVGRVSMDLLTVDISDLPEGAAHRGDLATLIGDGIDVDSLAARIGTISYEVLTGLGRRYHRLYREAGA